MSSIFHFLFTMIFVTFNYISLANYAPCLHHSLINLQISLSNVRVFFFFSFYFIIFFTFENILLNIQRVCLGFSQIFTARLHKRKLSTKLKCGKICVVDNGVCLRNPGKCVSGERIVSLTGMRYSQ